jgi:hypothetical protein
LAQETAVLQPLIEQFPTQINREIISEIREFLSDNRDFFLESTIHFSRPFFCSGHGRNLFLPAVLQVRGTRCPAISCPQKCALDSGSRVLLPLLKLRIVCEPKGLPFMVSRSRELEMPGQVGALNYPKECRGGAFMANP